MNSKQSDALERVMDLVRFLRANCPWDARQTPRSLIPYLLEEANETADAIAEADDDELRAELGDLLLNVAFQLVLGEERDAFGAGEVADTVIEKMQRRHPHLYGLGEQEDWETLKARERAEGETGVLDGVARGLDPLSKAHRIQDRVAAVGFDWDDARGALAKLVEELDEVEGALGATTASAAGAATTPDGAASGRGPASATTDPDPHLEEEIGDLLFAVVNVARLSGIHSRTALQKANAKFTRRFRGVEALARERGIALDTAGLDRLEALWQEVKASEAAGATEAAEATDARPGADGE